LDNLAALRNVIEGVFNNPAVRALAPARTTPPLPMPALGSTVSSASLHDHHNLEIKTVTEVGNRPCTIETDIYLFAPRSFELNAIGKAELRKDVRTRLRLSIPVRGDQDSFVFENALRNVQRTLELITTKGPNVAPIEDLAHPLCEELMETLKDLTAFISESLKNGAGEQARLLINTDALMSTPLVRANALRSVRQKLEVAQDFVERARELKIEESTETEGIAQILKLFDEYISQLYVQFLGALHAELHKHENVQYEGSDEPSAVARVEHSALLELLFVCQTKEAKHRANPQRGGAQNPTDLDREQRLVRLGQLKKFFQSKTFVDVSSRPPPRLFTESTAAAGTALAGIIATLVERVSKPDISNMAFQGLFVVFFGVIIYTLRDRMKDRVKTILNEKAIERMPDSQHHLIAREKKMGLTREWFRVTTLNSLVPQVRKLRKSAFASELEGRLHEDVFHCRRIQDVSASDVAVENSQAIHRTLYENTRLNLERHLKLMDDPFKDMTDLDFDGKVLLSRSHKVYHFYLCIRNRCYPTKIESKLTRVSRYARAIFLRPALFKKIGLNTAPKSNGVDAKDANLQHRLYRVVLDKTGLVRIEEISSGT
jgi:hypothetical protein